MKLKKACKNLTLFINIIITIFGLFVYTTEYNLIKNWLNKIISIKISRLFLIIIIIVIIDIILWLIHYISDLKIRINTLSENKITENDKSIMKIITDTFNAPNLIYYLSDNDLGNDFDNSVFQPLLQLSLFDKDLKLIFKDDNLKQKKDKLIKSINSFLSFKAVNTFPTNLNTQALKTWNDAEYDYNEHSKLSNEFNDLATDIYNTYQDLLTYYTTNLS